MASRKEGNSVLNKIAIAFTDVPIIKGNEQVLKLIV